MTTRRLIWITGIGVGVYVSTYLILSAFGRYEPTIWGMGEAGYAPKASFYVWAPRGFVSDWLWNKPAFAIYYPMLTVDHSFWHTDSDRWNGRYPVHEYLGAQPEPGGPANGGQPLSPDSGSMPSAAGPRR